MAPERTRKSIKLRQQMSLALELRLAGAPFQQIGKSLDPSVSRQRAWRIVRNAVDEFLIWQPGGS
jgi:hypothetical protein